MANQPNPPAAAAPLDRERLASALSTIAQVEPDVDRELARIGLPAPRVRPPGFATLLRVVVGQQLSVRAAAAIWRRLETRLGGAVEAATFCALDDMALREVGFSRRKAAYARGLAQAIEDGSLPLDALARMDRESAIARITALPGFGRWSAEIYLLFALGDADAFPADDLAVQAALQRLKRLPGRPRPREARAIVEPWAPWRGAGAIFLWHLHGSATLDDRG
jgi:DNA-3-methyladenine glycosylase II